MRMPKLKHHQPLMLCVGLLSGALLASSLPAHSNDIPVADVHVHYSHDSVELTPPARVIELMREANLKFALVSSSDDRGTQLLLKEAPDMIIAGLRPYSRRGQTGSWMSDPKALEYVEGLLERGTYATIGEFHLYGEDADLEIPQRIVQLADEHNLLLHAHSDADAVERLLASSDTVRVIWAHAGFDNPDEIAAMLGKHDRLWADLAFRSEVGSGGTLSDEWRQLFDEFPDRLMLGTDTYTPERMYFVPEHAAGARTWLETLPPELAEQLAWKNAYNLLMPVWQKNKAAADDSACATESTDNEWLLPGDEINARLQTESAIKVGQAFAVDIELCGSTPHEVLGVNATMPKHGHGMNYEPELGARTDTTNGSRYRAEGLLFHMPGEWEWAVTVKVADELLTLKALTQVQ